MEKVTLEQTHALLEKLADYVTDRIPRIENKLTELETRLEQKADKVDLLRLAEKTDGLQKNVDRLDGKMDMILEGMDAQTQQLDIIRTDMKAIGGTLDLHERRLGDLEQRTFGYRVRDKGDKYD